MCLRNAIHVLRKQDFEFPFLADYFQPFSDNLSCFDKKINPTVFGSNLSEEISDISKSKKIILIIKAILMIINNDF